VTAATAKDLISRSEAAERLHVSERTARRLGDAGELDEVRVSWKVVRVTRASVEHLRSHGVRSVHRDDEVEAA
jgi:excisionase family DNA binding protein